MYVWPECFPRPYIQGTKRYECCIHPQHAVASASLPACLACVLEKSHPVRQVAFINISSRGDKRAPQTDLEIQTVVERSPPQKHEALSGLLVYQWWMVESNGVPNCICSSCPRPSLWTNKVKGPPLLNITPNQHCHSLWHWLIILLPPLFLDSLKPASSLRVQIVILGSVASDTTINFLENAWKLEKWCILLFLSSRGLGDDEARGGNHLCFIHREVLIEQFKKLHNCFALPAQLLMLSEHMLREIDKIANEMKQEHKSACCV